MPILSFSQKWKNILILTLFFLAGIFLIEPMQTGGFLLIAILLSRFIAKEYKSTDTYIDEQSLCEFSKVYYYAYYRMILSGLYVVIMFRNGELLTLDITFFLIWFVGSSFLWFTAFFIPSDGVIESKLDIFAFMFMLVVGISNLSIIAWLLTMNDGFAWFSPLIVESSKTFLDNFT